MAPDITFPNSEQHRVATGESLDGIAKNAGITWQQLAQFNWGTSNPTEVNECLHDLVGCRHKTNNGKNYMFNSSDDPGIIAVPVKSPKYSLSTTKTHVIQVVRPHPRCNLEIETVDDFLHVVCSVTVVLRRQEGGPNVEITSDENGYGISKGILTGHYEVTVKGGGKAYFLKHTNKADKEEPGGDYGEYTDAVIDTRQFAETVTQLVVKRIATPAQKQQRKLLHKVYTRTNTQSSNGRGDETRNSSGYTRLQPVWMSDNLALVAGWTDDSVDISNLVSNVLRDFFSCQNGSPANRGFYVWVVEAYDKPPRISLYNSSGSAEARFDLATKVTGLFGVYSGFEDVDGQLFVDMMTKSNVVSPDGAKGAVPVLNLVAADDRQKMMDAANAHAGQKEILYFLPTLAQLAWIGVHGGSGRLEDYGNEESVNKRIHERNKRVCQRVSFLYNGYIEGYIKRVKATTNEKELRKLGPPWAPYVFPPPAGSQSVPPGASASRMSDLYDCYDFQQLKAWRAVAMKIDDFGDRISDGGPFISVRFKYEIPVKAGGAEEEAEKSLLRGLVKVKEVLPTSVEVESRVTFQLNDGEFRTLAGIEEKAKIAQEGEIKGYEFGLEYKRDLKKPLENAWEVTLRGGIFELETSKEGTAKVSIQAFPEVWSEALYEPNQATFEGGLKIKTKRMFEHLEKLHLKHGKFKEFLEKYGNKAIPEEVSVHVGMAGLKESTVLALVSNAPGFFEVRDTADLVRLPWNGLTLDEQVHLGTLEWNQCSWDLKSFADAELPETMEHGWSELSAKQQISILHLGFPDAEAYHNCIERSRNHEGGWKQAIEKMQCKRKEGEEGGGPATGE